MVTDKTSIFKTSDPTAQAGIAAVDLSLGNNSFS